MRLSFPVFSACTLKVSNIPTEMDEGRLKKYFEDRLRATLEKVLQVTVRARDGDRLNKDREKKRTFSGKGGFRDTRSPPEVESTKDDAEALLPKVQSTNEETEAERYAAFRAAKEVREKVEEEKHTVSHDLSWGLLTVASSSAVTILMHKCGPPTVLEDMPVIEVQQVDIHKATASQGLFGAVFKEGQKKAHNELTRLREKHLAEMKKKEEATARRRGRLHGAVGQAGALGQHASRFQLEENEKVSSPRVAGAALSPRAVPDDGSLPMMSPQQRSSTMQATESTPMLRTVDKNGVIVPDEGALVPPVPLDFLTSNQFMSTRTLMTSFMADERIPTAKRPGRDLPDHWPTSDISRENSHARTKLLTTKNALGVGPEARRKEKMRKLRVERKRAQDIETYHATFKMIDVDDSGKVDPMEIVAFVEQMGKKINTSR